MSIFYHATILSVETLHRRQTWKLNSSAKRTSARKTASRPSSANAATIPAWCISSRLWSPAQPTSPGTIRKPSGLSSSPIPGAADRDYGQRCELFQTLPQGRTPRRLKRLRLHGLIKKIGRTYKYYLTKLGRKVVLTALKLRELVVIPALAQLRTT